jgi:hypothetical protein
MRIGGKKMEVFGVNNSKLVRQKVDTQEDKSWESFGKIML